MVATALIASHRSGSEAFAQGTGAERHIVAQGVYSHQGEHWGYRVWSDNATEVRALGVSATTEDSPGDFLKTVASTPAQTGWRSVWQVVDAGTPAFLPTDIDRSGQIDSGDIAQVLLEFSETVDQTTPPPIDCNINAPR